MDNQLETAPETAQEAAPETAQEAAPETAQEAAPENFPKTEAPTTHTLAQNGYSVE